MSRTPRVVAAGLAGIVGLASLTLLTAPTSYAAPGPKAASNPAKTVELQLLAINDFHGNLEPPTGSGGQVNTGGVTGRLDSSGRPVPNSVAAGGVSFLGDQLTELREGQKNSLTVAAGDMVGASPLISALFRDEPTIEALNLLGLDLAAVGNHEFDEGVDELLRLQEGGCHPVDGCATGQDFAGADFPYLAANVVDRRSTASSSRAPRPSVASSPTCGSPSTSAPRTSSSPRPTMSSSPATTPTRSCRSWSTSTGPSRRPSPTARSAGSRVTSPDPAPTTHRSATSSPTPSSPPRRCRPRVVPLWRS